MLRESEVFVYYFDVRVLLCCRWEFFVVVLLGMNVFLNAWAIELVSERCIVSLLDRVVEVKPTYILLLSEIQSPRGHLNLYITLVFCNTPICIYTYICVCVCICTFLYIYIYTYIYRESVFVRYVYMSVFARIWIYVCVFLSVCICIYFSVFYLNVIFLCVCVYMFFFFENMCVLV